MGATYIECSAKEAKGVTEVFEQAINTAIKAEEESWDRTGSAGNANAGVSGAKGRKKAKKRSCKIL